jgi:hypothetical protein
LIEYYEKKIDAVMKNKLILFGFVFIFLIPQTFAQLKRKVDEGIRFGVLGGFSFQSFMGTDYWGDPLGDQLSPCFNAGGNVTFPVIADLFVQPGLSYSMKGTKQNIITDDITKTVILSYIELPVDLLYRPQLGNGYLLIGAGGYGSCGISGRERTKSGTITIELPVRFQPDASEEPTSYAYYKRFDAGVNALVGYELFNGIFFQLNGQLGLLEINSDYGLPNDQTSKKNYGFGISAGYRF